MNTDEKLIEQLDNIASLLDDATLRILNDRKNLKVSQLVEKNRELSKRASELQNKIDNKDEYYRMTPENQVQDNELAQTVASQIIGYNQSKIRIDNEREQLSRQKDRAQQALKLAGINYQRIVNRQESIERLRSIDSNLAASFEQEYNNNASLLQDSINASNNAQNDIQRIEKEIDRLDKEENEYNQMIASSQENLDKLKESNVSYEFDISQYLSDQEKLENLQSDIETNNNEYAEYNFDIFNIDRIKRGYQSNVVDTDAIKTIVGLINEFTSTDELNSKKENVNNQIEILDNTLKNDNNYAFKRRELVSIINNINARIAQNDSAYETLTTYNGSREEVQRILNEKNELDSLLNEWKNKLDRFDAGEIIVNETKKQRDLDLKSKLVNERDSIEDKISKFEDISKNINSILDIKNIKSDPVIESTIQMDNQYADLNSDMVSYILSSMEDDLDKQDSKVQAPEPTTPKDNQNENVKNDVFENYRDSDIYQPFESNNNKRGQFNPYNNLKTDYVDGSKANYGQKPFSLDQKYIDSLNRMINNDNQQSDLSFDDWKLPEIKIQPIESVQQELNPLFDENDNFVDDDSLSDSSEKFDGDSYEPFPMSGPSTVETDNKTYFDEYEEDYGIVTDEGKEDNNQYNLDSVYKAEGSDFNAYMKNRRNFYAWLYGAEKYSSELELKVAESILASIPNYIEKEKLVNDLNEVKEQINQAKENNTQPEEKEDDNQNNLDSENDTDEDEFHESMDIIRKFLRDAKTSSSEDNLEYLGYAESILNRIPNSIEKENLVKELNEVKEQINQAKVSNTQPEENQVMQNNHDSVDEKDLERTGDSTPVQENDNPFSDLSQEELIHAINNPKAKSDEQKVVQMTTDDQVNKVGLFDKFMQAISNIGKKKDSSTKKSDSTRKRG